MPGLYATGCCPGSGSRMGMCVAHSQGNDAVSSLGAGWLLQGYCRALNPNSHGLRLWSRQHIHECVVDEDALSTDLAAHHDSQVFQLAQVSRGGLPLHADRLNKESDLAVRVNVERLNQFLRLDTWCSPPH